METAQLVISKF